MDNRGSLREGFPVKHVLDLTEGPLDTISRKYSFGHPLCSVKTFQIDDEDRGGQKRSLESTDT
jgi:hypothetical protein